MKKDNKKALYESIMTAVAKEVKKALNEGAGAGYDVTFEGLNVKSVRLGKPEMKGRDEIIKFTATLDKSVVEWKAIGYYEGVTSKGIYYNDDLVDDFDDQQKTVEGGEVSGYVYLEDVRNRRPTWESAPIKRTDIKAFIIDWLTDFSVTSMYGRGWIHQNLTDPIILTDIEVQDSYHVSYVYIDTIEIKAPEITKVVNWYFENYLDFDKIYGDDEEE